MPGLFAAGEVEDYLLSIGEHLDSNYCINQPPKNKHKHVLEFQRIKDRLLSLPPDSPEKVLICQLALTVASNILA